MRIICIASIFIWLLGCSAGSGSSTVANSKRNSGTSGSGSGGSGGDGGSTGGDYDDSNIGRAPTDKNINLGAAFNVAPRLAVQTPDGYKKPLLVKPTSYYRAIYFDLEKKKWSNSRGQLDQVTVHQPLSIPEIPAFDQEGYPLDFVHLGHRAYEAQARPSDYTIMITPSPYTTDSEDALKSPKNYESIYQRVGQTKESFLKDCGERLANLEKTMFSLTFDWGPFFVCDTFMGGLVPNGGFRGSGLLVDYTFNPATMAYNSGYDLLLQHSSVRFWRPIPENGYECLGDVITNTLARPQFVDDNDTSPFRDYRPVTRAAVYCVKKDMVAPGVLKPENLVMQDGKVFLYKIVAADDAVGYSSGNLFYAVNKLVNGKPDYTSPKVFVLKRDKIFELASLKFDPQTYEPGTK